MTTTATLPTVPAAATEHRTGVTQRRVIRSEWIKFWSLRSTVITLAAAVVTFIGFGIVAALITVNGTPSGPGGGGDFSSNPVDVSLAGSTIAQLVLGTLGVLFMASEYTTGMIRSTLAAVPGRLGVLWAKAAVFGAVSFGLMLVSAFIAFLAGQAILGDAGVSLSDDGVVRALVGTAAYVTGAGLLGLGLGALLRSTASAVSTYFGVMFLLSSFAGLLLPESWQDTVTPYLPTNAGAAIGAVVQIDGNLTPLAGLAVFAAYLVAVGGAAAWRLTRQDA